MFVTSLREFAADLRGRLAQTNAAILEGLRDEIRRAAGDPAAQELRRLVSQGTSASFVGFERIALFHFWADVTGDRPCFDYRLREDASEQRLGMTLLRQQGVLDRVGCSYDD
jgi:hypothetical protein